jgi:hypothetical protein
VEDAMEDDFEEWETERYLVDLDAAREERRREGKDVEHEVSFVELDRKIKAGETLTPEERKALDGLLRTLQPLIRYARDIVAWDEELED